MVFCDFSVRHRPRRGEALRVSNEKRQDPVPLLHSPFYQDAARTAYVCSP